MTASGFPDLQSLQTLFSELIRSPEGVARGASRLALKGELQAEDLSHIIALSDRMTPSERLDIYANMYFYRLHDCLSEDYPKTFTRVGAAHFNNLVTDYLLAHPPSHYSLREVGREFPGFISEQGLARRFPALGDLAQLEWARFDVFDEADAPVLDREGLMLGSGDNPEAFFIRAIPAARVLQLDPRALDAWDAPDDEATRASTRSGVTPEIRSIVVWRSGFRVQHRPSLPDEAHCLEAMMSGALSLAELGERLLGHDRSADESAELFASLLEQWLSNGLLTQCEG